MFVFELVIRNVWYLHTLADMLTCCQIYYIGLVHDGINVVLYVYKAIVSLFQTSQRNLKKRETLTENFVDSFGHLPSFATCRKIDFTFVLKSRIFVLPERLLFFHIG